ncbi:RNA-binding protein Y14A (OsY14a) (RNA-binding protein 8A) [Durusdinium trenchii]
MDVDYDEEVEDTRPAGRRMKGRGGEDDDRYAGKAGKFERLDDDDDETAGLNQKMWEDDIFEAFSEYGDIKNLHLNLDRRTGFVKGYAFIEYENKQEADLAVKSMDGNTLLDHKLEVSWAFAKPGSKKKGRR